MRLWRRDGFISVGAVGQRLLSNLLLVMAGAWSLVLRVAAIARRLVGGIGSSVLRRRGVATGRWNSSLRSRRTRRSQGRRVFSGLNKTMFASAGPNSRCRGLRAAPSAEPRGFREESDCRPGRMKASRGLPSDGAVALATAAQIPPHVSKSNLSPRLSDLFLSSEAGLVGGRGAIPSWSALDRLSGRGPWRTGCAAAVVPWRRWPWPCRSA